MTPHHLAAAISAAENFDQLKGALSSLLTIEPPPPPVAEIELLTVKEARAVLGGISKASFYELAKEPGFPAAYRLNARIVRYARADLLDWLRTTKSPPPPAAG